MSGWDFWKNEIHSEKKQVIKQKKAIESECKPKKINEDDFSAIFIASKDNSYYETYLSECTCPSFKRELVPCKHMYRLAYELGFAVPPAKLEYGYKKREALVLFNDIDKEASELFKSISDYEIEEKFLIEDSPQIQQLICIGFVDVCEDENTALKLILQNIKKDDLFLMCKNDANCPAKSSRKDILVDYLMKNKDLININDRYTKLCVCLSRNIDGLINSILHAHHRKYPYEYTEEFFDPDFGD